ncbi:MAG: FliA/WhiG family RNA polymerase sigma factor [Chloroflexi bacterium]|nr:FliA/WhiG family RNA polymerase sigma factor [Chloroflexota bacterium]
MQAGKGMDPQAVGVDDLWNQYVASRDPALREKLILQYAPLVKYVVGRLAINLPTILDSEDIISYGIIGLMDAVERFDPTRSVKFETYAIARIRGAIIDGLRSLDQIPRTARQRARDVEQAFVELEARLGRPPNDDEVAAHLGMDLERFHQVIMRSSMHTLSLDSLLQIDDDSAPLTRGDLLEDKEGVDPEEYTERRELHHRLMAAVQRLPERERLVLALYYHEELTMKEISRVMEISESRVCQLHGQAILRLRGYLSERTVSR